jgi:hypothetical protein
MFAKSKMKCYVRESVSIPVDAFLKTLLCTSGGCVISWNRAYCLFPIAMHRRLSYITTPLARGGRGKWQEENLRLYSGESTLVDAPREDPFEVPATSRGELGPVRQFGDKYSWIFPLDTTSVPGPYESRTPLDSASFLMRLPLTTSIDVMPYFKLECAVLESRVLRHKYMCVPEFWSKSLDELETKLGWQFFWMTVGLDHDPPRWEQIDPAYDPVELKALLRFLRLGNTSLGMVIDYWPVSDAKVQKFLEKLKTSINSTPATRPSIDKATQARKETAQYEAVVLREKMYRYRCYLCRCIIVAFVGLLLVDIACARLGIYSTRECKNAGRGRGG